MHDLMTLAMCATYDPDASAPYGVRLPVTMDTCEVIPERWQNFVAWDPLTLVGAHGEGLKKLKAFYFDCGDIDQFNLVYGARRLHKRLEAMGVAAHLRGIRGRPHRGRLPDGREPADPGAGAERLIQAMATTGSVRLFRNARLATLDPAREGLGIVEKGAVAARDGRIVYAGPEADLPGGFAERLPTSSIARGGWVTPGLIDCHTHLVYAGDRAQEFELRLKRRELRGDRARRRRHPVHGAAPRARRRGRARRASPCRASTR